MKIEENSFRFRGLLDAVVVHFIGLVDKAAFRGIDRMIDLWWRAQILLLSLILSID